MSSLKEALLKAGFTSSPKPQPVKKEDQVKNVNPPPKKTPHQSIRTFCEECKNILPDVELYNHRNPSIGGNWLCTDCADKNCLPDEIRKTAQSEASRRGIFKR